MVLSSPLETPRLFLRTLLPLDLNARYLSWLSDPEVNRSLELRFSPPQSLDSLAAFVRSVNASADSLLLGMVLKDEDRHIGNIKLGPINEHHQRAEIGFLIGERDCWGKGYASESIAALSRYGLDTLGLEKITSGCYETNPGSAKALLKAGFIHEATIPSHVIVEGRRVASLLFGLDRPVTGNR